MTELAIKDERRRELYTEKWEQEFQRRERLIEEANHKNKGKSIENEAATCESFIRVSKNPSFSYLVAYEWEYEEGHSNLGAGDLVFSFSPDMSTTCNVLVIEAKYLNLKAGRTARDARTEHRKKVGLQVRSSMDAWKKNNPNHTVYGAILMNEEVSGLGSNCIADGVYLSNMISSIAEEIPTLPFEVDIDKSPPLKLDFYPPFPRSLWGIEYKPFMDLSLWEEIKRERFDHASNTCEMCHSTSARAGNDDLVLHQRWKYICDEGGEDGEDKEEVKEMTVQFDRFDVLCLKCHDLVHVGRATMEGRKSATLAHFQEKANETPYETELELEIAIAEWIVLNSRKVVEIDHSRIFSCKAVMDWLGKDKRRCVGRFGNFCCFQHFNPQLPKQFKA